MIFRENIGLSLHNVPYMKCRKKKKEWKKKRGNKSPTSHVRAVDTSYLEMLQT